MDNIKEKIQKVLELAARGGTEAEANTAMSKALELLAKHGLSMSDVSTEELIPEDESVEEQREDGDKGQVWQRTVWFGVSQLYFCKYYFVRTRLGLSHCLVGKPTNISTVRSVSKYLIGIAKQLAQDAGQDVTYRNSFKAGFASRVYHRCIAERQSAIQGKLINQDTGRALIVKPLYELTAKENDSFLAAKNVKLRSTRGSSSCRNSDGYEAGRRAGNSASLTGPSNVKRIGN